MGQRRLPFDGFTLNVGNTHTTLVSWRRGEAAGRLQWKTGAEPPCAVGKMLRARAARRAPVVLAGVVPEQKKRLAAFLRKRGCEVLVFRKDLKPNIEIAPRPAERVGDDRIAGAMGALALDPKRPWVIVDMGTAMTINAVTPGRAGRPPRFEGGLIAPGSMTSLLALSEYTAQLPLLERPPVAGWPRSTFIGRSTTEAMLLGVYHAQVGAAVALVKGQMRELGPRARVALTGGGALDTGFGTDFMAAFPRGKVIPHGELVHWGLFSVWESPAAQRK